MAAGTVCERCCADLYCGWWCFCITLHVGVGHGCSTCLSAGWAPAEPRAPAFVPQCAQEGVFGVCGGWCSVNCRAIPSRIYGTNSPDPECCALPDFPSPWSLSDSLPASLPVSADTWLSFLSPSKRTNWKKPHLSLYKQMVSSSQV